jgi:hypothetical protein
MVLAFDIFGIQTAAPANSAMATTSGGNTPRPYIIPAARRIANPTASVAAIARSMRRHVMPPSSYEGGGIGAAPAPAAVSGIWWWTTSSTSCFACSGFRLSRGIVAFPPGVSARKVAPGRAGCTPFRQDRPAMTSRVDRVCGQVSGSARP